MYIKEENNVAIEYSLNQLRKDNPNTSFPFSPSDALLAEWGVYRVIIDEKPIINDLTQELIEHEVQKIDGVWKIAWTVQQLPLDVIKDNYLDKLANRRHIAEEAGTTIILNGLTVSLPTDKNTLTKIHSAYTRSLENTSYSLDNWKLQKGVFISLTSEDIIAIGGHVSKFIQDCFDNEAFLSSSIQAATTIEEIEAVDIETNWPA